mgnify:CR=1 FL=1
MNGVIDWSWIQRNRTMIAQLIAEHIVLSIVPVLAAFVISIPLGYLVFRTGRFANALLAILGALATGEYFFATGDATQARIFAMRAREKLDKDTPEWRRATDIVLTSNPSREDLKELAAEGAVVSRTSR